MKRITGILLSICILVSIIVFAEPAETSVECGRELALFEYIEAYSAPDNVSELGTQIRRAAFVDIVAQVINANESGRNVYYVDVARDNPYVSSINALRELGFLSNQEQYFRPDDPITYAEAAKIVLSIAGYDVYANAVGGFPAGYLTAAARLEILPNCTDSNALTYAEALIMIYNAFTMGTYDIKMISGDVDLTYMTGSETVFSIYRNIYVAEGILTATQIASSNGDTVGENQVIVDGKKYNIDENIYTDRWFLNHVEFFYEEQDENINYIFYMADAENRTGRKDLTISFEDLHSFDPSSYTVSYYLANERLQTHTFPRSSVVYYNGSEYTESLSAIFDEFLTEDI